MGDALSTEDQLAIRDIVARYAWALDTGDVEGFVNCFCRDGMLIWDAFDVPERWEGHEELRHFATFIRELPSSAGRQHHVSNTVIDVREDGVRSKSYAVVALRQGDGPHNLHVMGYYEDLFRREEGQWRLAERVIRDWSGPILKAFPGQTEERAARPMPPALAGAAYRRPGD